MGILIFIIIVLVVLALVCYVVELIPLPGPGFIKRLIQALLVLIAAIVIIDRAGLLNG